LIKNIIKNTVKNVIENIAPRSLGSSFKSGDNDDEVRNFDSIAGDWWQEDGPFKPLHQLNHTRLSFIRNHIIHKFGEDFNWRGLSCLDVGCGGGILAEPLARMGLNVTGIDLSPNAIAVAQKHSHDQGLSIDYINIAIEEVADKTSKNKFDVICALEIIEHLDDVQSFLSHCVNLLSNDGILFISTLNKTLKSYTHGILAAEYLLRWVPVGTHTYSKFLKPSMVCEYLSPLGVGVDDIRGICYKPSLNSSSNNWYLGDDISVNYIMAVSRRCEHN